VSGNGWPGARVELIGGANDVDVGVPKVVLSFVVCVVSWWRRVASVAVTKAVSSAKKMVAIL
jgi:hypothetical protein